jgi:hypothetical protein
MTNAQNCRRRSILALTTIATNLMPPFEFSRIERYVLSLHDELHRFHSWDICFTEFSTNDNTHSLALHLGFYLASWGMYRGSSGLLQRNYKVHLKAVEILKSPAYATLYHQSSSAEMRNNIPLIMELRDALSTHYRGISFARKGVPEMISDTDTLLSKVILGTTGCVPAFDRYFIAGLKSSGIKNTKFNSSSLNDIVTFVDENNLSFARAVDYVESKTRHRYPLMKLVDMYFWQAGFDASLPVSNLSESTQ